MDTQTIEVTLEQCLQLSRLLTPSLLGVHGTTPPSISKRIKRFLSKSGLYGTPVYLPFTHKSDKFKAGFCLANCEAESKQTNHKIIYGWLIWQDRRNEFIEAEFHAVIESDDGLVDITPRVDGEELVLFMPDKYRTAKLIDDKTWESWGNIKSKNGSIYQRAMKRLFQTFDSYGADLNQAQVNKKELIQKALKILALT